MLAAILTVVNVLGAFTALRWTAFATGEKYRHDFDRSLIIGFYCAAAFLLWPVALLFFFSKLLWFDGTHLFSAPPPHLRKSYRLKKQAERIKQLERELNI